MPRVEYLTPSTYLSPQAQGSVQFLGNYQIFELHDTQLVVSAQFVHLTLLSLSLLDSRLAYVPHRSQTTQLIQPNFLYRHSLSSARSVQHVNNTKQENYTLLLISSTLHQKHWIKNSNNGERPPFEMGVQTVDPCSVFRLRSPVGLPSAANIAESLL
jgi:hypothetical protein